MADSRLEMIFNGLNAQYLHPILREQIEDVYTFILKHQTYQKILKSILPLIKKEEPPNLVTLLWTLNNFI